MMISSQDQIFLAQLMKAVAQVVPFFKKIALLFSKIDAWSSRSGSLKKS
jgi:hypothetical protein